jgi:hypothetical protein
VVALVIVLKCDGLADFSVGIEKMACGIENKQNRMIG